MVIHMASAIGEINSVIKAIASGCVCACPSPWLYISAEKATQFPIFYEVATNNLRPPQPAWFIVQLTPAE